MNPKVSLFNADKKVNKGQSLAEYGLILALIAVVCVGMLGTIGKSINDKLTTVNAKLAE